jgi:hypothetical protein
VKPEERASQVWLRIAWYIANAIREAVADEREACALIAAHHPEINDDDESLLQCAIAKAIRARGQS